jgi:hypothetical protein
MSAVDETESPGSRWILVPYFKPLRSRTQRGTQQLNWIPRGTRRAVQGFKTTGGFYIQRPHGANFSFAVDESLPVGRVASARPISLRPGQCVGYHKLDPDQRAAYLHWVSSGNLSPDNTAFCVRIHIAALEWMLFVQRATPSTVIDEILDLVKHPGLISEAPLLRLLAWVSFFQNRSVHIAVLKELVAWGFHLDGSLVRLLLHDCAEADQYLWPELATEVQCICGYVGHAAWSAEFRQRFSSRFGILYPHGLRIEAEQSHIEVEYKVHCPELAGERCRLRVRDAVPTALSALREVAAPLLREARLDITKAARISEETVRVQAFLSGRGPDSLASALVAPQLPEVMARSELDNTCVDVLAKLIERPEWSERDFQRLTKAHGRMPFALIEQLNSWAMEKFDEPLLDGGGPVTVNKNLIKEIKRKYE